MPHHAELLGEVGLTAVLQEEGERERGEKEGRKSREGRGERRVERGEGGRSAPFIMVSWERQD